MSLEKDPINVKVNRIEIFKAIYPDKEFNELDFHSNIQNFTNAVHKNDSLH